MYFASRVQAGRMLANRLAEKYQGKTCAVLALNDGGVMVGAEIALKLQCVLTLLPTAEINLPRETEAIAGITASGEMAYNQKYSPGEIDELVGEYRALVEQEKLNQMHQLNILLGKGGTVNKDLLKGHNVILVADGLKNGFPLDLAYQFLKPVALKSLIVAVPLASVPAVDRMHVLADDLYCLSVVADYTDTDHYYDQKDVPGHETIIQVLEQVVTKWR